MTTIPQRLRDIAEDADRYDRTVCNAILEIANELEAPASDAVSAEVVAEYLYGHPRSKAVEWAKEDKFDSCYRQAEEICDLLKISALQQQLGECTGGYETMEREVAALQARIAELEAPAADAVQVVGYLYEDAHGNQYLHQTRNTAWVAPPQPLIRKSDHIASVWSLQGRINELESDIKQLEADWSRLDWMQFRGAKVCWDNDGEVCDVQWSDRDGAYKTGLFIDWRAAIDAAIGGHFKEQP